MTGKRSTDSFVESSRSKGSSPSNADLWKHYVVAIQTFQHRFIADKYGAPRKNSQENNQTEPSLDRPFIKPREDPTVKDLQQQSNLGAGFINSNIALTASTKREATGSDGPKPGKGRSETADQKSIQNVSRTSEVRMMIDADHRGPEDPCGDVALARRSSSEKHSADREFQLKRIPTIHTAIQSSSSSRQMTSQQPHLYPPLHETPHTPEKPNSRSPETVVLAPPSLAFSKQVVDSDKKSNKRDKAICRQEELTMVGPRSYDRRPGVGRRVGSSPAGNTTGLGRKPTASQNTADGKLADQRILSKSNIEVKATGSGAQGNAQAGQSEVNEGASTIVAGGAEAEPSDVRDELKRLQEEVIVKIGNKVLGIDTDGGDDSGPLQLARQGPGTDPTSKVAQGFAYLLTDRAKFASAFRSSELATGTVAETGSGQRRRIGSITSGTSSSSRSQILANPEANSGPDSVPHCPTKNSPESIDVKSPGYALDQTGDQSESEFESGDRDFTPVLVDWQYRPWQTYNDPSFVDSFRRWLENTMRLGCLVNIEDKHFYDGSLHPDGIKGMFLPQLEEPISFLDFSDQGNAMHSHETAAGYIYNWNERLERERRANQELRKKAIVQRQAADTYEPKPNPNVPKANIYLRPVEAKDIPGLLAIFNWYVENTLRCIDIDQLSFQDMQDRVDESDRENLPFLVAAERQSGFGHAMNDKDEKILGYAMASDFTGPRTANRFTAELELFVHPHKHRLGIGRCLLDKILEICDPTYLPRHGYFFDCAPDKRPLYCSGGNRSLMRLIFIIHHPADHGEEYKWIKEWLERDYDFEEQALLKGTGVKNQSLMNASYLVRNTGHTPYLG